MISGLILAGGSGRRLGGVRKGDLRLGNTPLRQWTISRLAPQVDTLLFSVAQDRRTGDDGLIDLPDAPDGVTGPAAGLLAGARWTSARDPEALMVSVSVDTPFFPPDFVTRALAMISPDVGCIVAGYGGRDYPTNALWNVTRLLEVLEGEIPAPKGPRLRDVAKRIGVAVCSYDGHAINPFAGINTLPDLLALSRLLRDGRETM